MSLGSTGRDAGALREIQRAGERARDLTRQLLAFARKQVVTPRSLDLNAQVRDTERMLRRLLNEDVELVTRLGQGLWPVWADPGQIEQILLNLAVNASDAMPGGGRLEIETSNVRLDEPRALDGETVVAGDYVAIEVRDSGTGMSDEALTHAFEPFFTTKPEGQGTGLGLATVHGIVHQCGGHVTLSSERGRGTRFRILFPREARAETAPTPKVPAPARGGRETVLVAEDDAAVRALAALALEDGGYRVLGGRSAGDRRGDAGNRRPAGRRRARAPPPERPRPLHVRLHAGSRGAARGAGGPHSFPREAVHAGRAARRGARSPRRRARDDGLIARRPGLARGLPRRAPGP
jgi:hypothetical protein